MDDSAESVIDYVDADDNHGATVFFILRSLLSRAVNLADLCGQSEHRKQWHIPSNATAKEYTVDLQVTNERFVLCGLELPDDVTVEWLQNFMQQMTSTFSGAYDLHITRWKAPVML
jgi:hypothetical protein